MATAIPLDGMAVRIAVFEVLGDLICSPVEVNFVAALILRGIAKKGEAQ